MKAVKWFTPRIRYNDDGEFGQVTGWLLTAPYLRHRFWLIGPRETAVTARLQDFEKSYCATLCGWRANLVRIFGRPLASHPRFELWRFNWTVYRLAPTVPCSGDDSAKA